MSVCCECRETEVVEFADSCLKCSLLSILDHGNVSIAGTADYVPIPYWSVQQAEVVPACRVDAESAKTISTVVKVSRLTNCPFNVKSGGHAAFAGGSSIEDGILINLAPMNQVTLSADRLTASIGPGNNWYDVYQVLDPKNVSIIGGREAGVGVGGLTLGGGISYFSGRYGWACDNVRTYEVGSIISMSRAQLTLKDCPCQWKDSQCHLQFSSRPLQSPTRRRRIKLRHHHTLRLRRLRAITPLGRFSILLPRQHPLLNQCLRQLRHQCTNR